MKKGLEAVRRAELSNSWPQDAGRLVEIGSGLLNDRTHGVGVERVEHVESHRQLLPGPQREPLLNTEVQEVDIVQAPAANGLHPYRNRRNLTATSEECGPSPRVPASVVQIHRPSRPYRLYRI